MRQLVLIVLISSVLSANTRGQLSVQLRADRDTFLLYEAIPLAVGIRNGTGRTVQIEPTGDRPWLSFLVVDETGNVVGSAGKPPPEEPVLIPAGETVTRTVDIVPLYNLRSQGRYRVQAMVDAIGMQAISPAVKFFVVGGRDLWSQTVGLPFSGKGADEYRTYSLVVRSAPYQDFLYVRIKDEVHQLIYGLLPLGTFLSVGQPEEQIDKQAQLHVLFQNAPRSFLYARIDPYGKVVDRAAYSDFLSKPHLVLAEGIASVRGGEQTYPKPERVMTNEEINPPKPLPAPKPKKKWWWPFGPKASSTGN